MKKLTASELAKLQESQDIMEINMGPQHPSTHGVLRLKVRLEGEIILSCEPIIGYLHTGVEKECETRTYHQVFTLVDRLDYLSGPAEEQVFAMAVEKLMDVEVPIRAQVLRVMMLELSRIASHLVWLGTSALELNMSSVFMYAMAEREKILDIFEEISGARMFPSIWRVGGLSCDTTDDFIPMVKAFIKDFPSLWKDLNSLLRDNYVWVERLKDIGIIDLETCKQYLCTGPVIRAAGKAFDIRKIYPYSGYETYTFDVPTEKEGDAYARYLVRNQEMLESLSIVEQAVNKLKPGPVITDNRKVAFPPRIELARSMEAVIHQFKLASEGLSPPIGKLQTQVESARGLLAAFLESDGTNRPYRLRIRSPSYNHVQVMTKASPGHTLSDLIVIGASLDPILGDVDR